MAFSWAGAGAGAQGALRQHDQDALEALLAQKRIEQEALNADLQRQRIEMERQRLGQDQEEFGWRKQQAQTTMDTQAADRRQQQNKAGVGQMVFSGLQQGTTTPKVGRLILAQEGVITPQQGLEDPEAEMQADVDRARQIAEAQYGTAAKYRAPAASQAEQFTLSPGQVRYGADGKVIARGNPQQAAGGAGGNAMTGGQSPYAAERNARTLQSVDELIAKVGPWTTGFGSLLKNIPTTDARNFAAELTTLKANIAFNELTQMREASKTGGALGQVSNIELQLLESALGALDPGQSPANIREQLQKIKASIQRWQAAASGAQPAAAKPGGVGIKSIREIK